VRELVAALRSDNARSAYALLSDDERKRVSFDDFALEWKQTGPERAWQAKALEESLKGNPDVGERANVSFSDGKLVQLEREGKTWRLESELVSRTRAKEPRDAVRMFAEAVAQRDVGALLNVLTSRRRDGLKRQLDGFITGLQKHVNVQLDRSGTDRAELRWDDAGMQYTIRIIKEDGEWRIDDIYIRAAGKDDGTKGSADVPGTLDDDF
jgi:hypothetical protein